MAAGLLEKKESEDSGAVIGPSMPEPEPPHPEVQLTASVCFLMNSHVKSTTATDSTNTTATIEHVILIPLAIV